MTEDSRGMGGGTRSDCADSLITAHSSFKASGSGMTGFWRGQRKHAALDKADAILAALSRPVEARPGSGGIESLMASANAVGITISHNRGALVEYDGWLLDDDYEAMPVLHRIMKRMRKRLEMSALSRPRANRETCPRAAIDNLTTHQIQCDEEGVMIQVSRQALDEVLAYLARTLQNRGDVAKGRPWRKKRQSGRFGSQLRPQTLNAGANFSSAAIRGPFKAKMARKRVQIP